jgi:hypothetical protein
VDLTAIRGDLPIDASGRSARLENSSAIIERDRRLVADALS